VRGCSLYGGLSISCTSDEPLNSSPAVGGSSALRGRLSNKAGFSRRATSEHRASFITRCDSNPSHGAGHKHGMTATTPNRACFGSSFPSNPHSSVLTQRAGGQRLIPVWTPPAVQINPQKQRNRWLGPSSGTSASSVLDTKCISQPVFQFAPLGAYGTWTRQRLEPSSTTASDQQSPSANPAAPPPRRAHMPPS